MKTLLLSLLLVVSASCSSREARVPEPKRAAPDTIKPGAPSVLTSQVEAQRAKLSLRFEGAGEGVSVVVSGLDGVSITSAPELLSAASVKAGEARDFEVGFTRGPGRGQLVISVTGTFGGAMKSRVHTVALGEGLKKDDGTVQVTNDGDTVKLMP